MTDKRKKDSHAADLWDYRRAKTLLDILALERDSSIELENDLLALCEAWEIDSHTGLTKGHPIPYFANMGLVQILASYVLEMGRKEVAERHEDESQNT